VLSLPKFVIISNRWDGKYENSAYAVPNERNTNIRLDVTCQCRFIYEVPEQF